MEKMQHFSIRKLSIGAASVLIGISFLGVKASTVKADSLPNTSEAELAKPKATNEVIKQDADSNIKRDAGSNIKQQDNGSDIKQEPASKTDVKQITSDQTNTTQAPVKPIAPKPDQQNTVANETKPQVPVKAKLQTNNAITPDEAGHTKVETTALMATANKKLNVQMLSESKIMSQTNDTNGGFDEATWGKLNVNDWKGSVQGDYYQLTDYTGDANHVIVPNEADFTKAGISTSGKQVGVTSSLMHSIFRDKTTAANATVAFSKTDNKQVKAIGTDWHNTWGHEKYPKSKAELSKFDGTNLDVSNVTNMNSILGNNRISDLSSLAGWETDRVTDMGAMFAGNQISNLAPLASWKVDHVTNMGGMFMDNRISDISPLANWRVSRVKRMLLIFDDNISSIQTKTIPAKRVINFVYPTDYTGKKQDSIIQTVDVPQKVNVELTTKYPKPSNNILDWVTKTETPEAPDPVYFPDYTVPEIKGLLEPDKTVISKQEADITKPINVTVTYEWAMSTTSKIVDSNPNDAFALDPKNGLHEHANVNNNGGYDEDYWGKLNINDWNYTANDNTITITGYKGNNQSSLIIPNGADFDLANGQGIGQSNVEISSSVMHDLAKNATRIGLSKTANKKVAASDAIWSDAFGGTTNEPGTDSNANGGIKYGSPNLTQMDLHNLDTATITDMSALFNGGSNLTVIGDLSEWNTNNVTNMRNMFQTASSLTNIGDLSKWQTSNVTDMDGMFSYVTNLTNIGDLSKWQTGNVTNMHNMFSNATSLTSIGNLDNWNTSKVTDMSWMFGTDSGKQSQLVNIGDLSKWQTGNVTDMHNMFANATNLTNIGNLDNWNTSNATNMSYMFCNATSLTNIGNLDNWNTSKVTDMSAMFGGTSSLTNIGNLDNWDTSKVTNMAYMFTNAINLTNIGNLSKWNTSKVTNMLAMFGDTNALRYLNISNWNLTKLANKDSMQYMFTEDPNLTVIANNLKLPTWYQNEVNNADYFWNNHMAVITNVPELIKATGDINNLKIDDQDASRSIFYDSKGSSDAIQVLKDANNQYIADYHKANPTKVLKLADTVDQNDPIALANASFVTVTYKLADSNTNDAFALDSKNGLHEHANVNDNGGYDADFWGKINVDDWNYTVSGDRIEINGLKDGVSTGANDTVIVPNLDDFKLAGKDGGAKTVYISSSTLGKTAQHKYYGLSKTNGNTFEINSSLAFAFYNNSNLTHADLNSLNTGNVTDMSNMFESASNLTSLDVSNWKTDNVTNMYAMFDDASSLTSLDVSKWDTDKVTNMNSMFSDANSLTSLDVSNWNTGNVTDMNWMFGSDSNLTTLDVSNWDTSKVTAMSYMFYGASSLMSLDVSNWDTGNVTAMSWMFNGASSLTSLDVSKWDTSNVTNMSYMFSGASSLTSLDVSKWDTGNVTDMHSMFNGASGLKSLDVSKWDTSNVTNMYNMFNNARALTSLDVSKWKTGNVTDMSFMFNGASGLKSLDVSNWDTGNVTNMHNMFWGASGLTNLDVSNWDTSKVTSMYAMFNNNPKLALIVNGDKFADYLVKNNFADSRINSSVKSVTTDNTKLLQLLTNDSQHDSATRTIVFTFPTSYSPDLTKYHLTKVGNTYQIKQSADYDKSYVQGTVLINATYGIAYHHIDTTKPNKLSDTWQPNYDKLVLAHKNADGTVSFDKVQLPQIPGYKIVVKTASSPVNPARARFAVSFMALPNPVAPVQNDTKPAETVSPATPVAIEVAKPIKTEAKAATSAAKVIDLSNDAVAVTPKTIDLSADVVATAPKETTWHVADEPDQDTYSISNGEYTVELPHISNTQLHVIANDSTKDSVLFTYKGQNTKYVFKIKFVNGHYLLTTYKIKSGKLVKLIDYNFTKSSKMIDVILDWIKL